MLNLGKVRRDREVDGVDADSTRLATDLRRPQMRTCGECPSCVEHEPDAVHRRRTRRHVDVQATWKVKQAWKHPVAHLLVDRCVVGWVIERDADGFDHSMSNLCGNTWRTLRLDKIEHAIDVDTPVLKRLDGAFEHLDAGALGVPAQQCPCAPIHQFAPSATTMVAAPTSPITTRA